MARAFITGISGQTGGYLAEHLAEQGWEVHGLARTIDDDSVALSGRVPSVELHVGDLADSTGLAGLVDRIEPDAVFHLGGLSSVAGSWAAPVETTMLTGVPTAVLLDAAWRLSGSLGREVAFVQASSAEIFGQADVSPQDERTPIRPSNPYGAAKAYGHHLVGVYRGLGLPASSCILYNHESPRRPEAFVTRKITRAAARISRGLQERLTLGNLDAVRDWGWAPDYARAIALAAGTPGDYVIATGVGHTVRDFVAAAFAAAGIPDWEPLVESDPALGRPGDAAALVGDAARAASVLGWTPSLTFEQIVAAMVEADLEGIDAEAGASV